MISKGFYSFLAFFLGLNLQFGFTQYNADSLQQLLNTAGNKSEILNLLAETVLDDSLELSLHYAKEAYKTAIEEESTREKGMALFWMGEYFAYQFQLDSATTYYEKALFLLKKAGDDYNTSYCLNNLGWIYNYYGQRQKAIDHYSESLQYLDREKHLEEVPNVYINIGNAYHHMGSYHTAIKYFHQAIPIIDNIEDKRALPIGYNGLGLAWKYLGNYDSAIVYYNRMLEIDKQTGTPFDLAIDYGNIGALYFEWGQLEQSRKFHQLSLDIYLKEGDKNSVSIAYNNLGEVYRAYHKPDSALHFYQKGIEIDKETGMEHRMAIKYNNIGEVYKSQKDYYNALHYYELALEINKKSENPYNIALNLSNIATIYHLTGNNQKAESLYNKSFQMAQEIGSNALLKSILEAMSAFYAETNRYAKAYQYRDQLSVLKDSIFKEKNQKLFADLQTRHELDQKEKAISVLNTENKLRREEARQYRTTTYFLSIGLTIIFGLLMVMIYQFNLRKKAYKKLVQKNKQLADSGKVQSKILEDKNLEAIATVLKPENGNGNGNHQELFEKLNVCLEKEKPFLQSNLTMKDLALQLNTNTHYLSEVINQRFGSNFAGLINEYRIREACRLLASDKANQFTIEGIAREAGFNSKSAFNNAFKSVTGLTPSYYKKTARAKK